MFKPITREERSPEFRDKLEEAYTAFTKGKEVSNEREAIRLLQRVWKRWGYYHGKVDGIWGPLTERAYQRWKEVMAIQEKVNHLLAKMGEGQLEVDGLYGRKTKAAVKKVQRMLKEVGLYRGKVDGIWGPLTEEAYGAWVEAQATTPDKEGPPLIASDSPVEVPLERRALVERLAEKAVEVGREKLGATLPVLVLLLDDPSRGGGIAYLYKEGSIVGEMPLSISPYGLGFAKGSGRTPSGLLFVETSHRPKAGVVKESRITKTPIYNAVWSVYGLERENANSIARSIAFHGTSPSREALVGQKGLSAGCYTARYEDLMRLYEEAGHTADGRRGFLLVVYSPKGPQTAFLREALGAYAELGERG